MIDFDSAVDSIIEIAFRYQPPDFYKYVLVCRYFYDFQEGPDSYWLNEVDSDVGWDNELIRQVSEVYLDTIHSEMKKLQKDGEANVFELVATKSSRPKYKYYLVEGQEQEKELQIKDQLGDEYYRRLKNTSDIGSYSNKNGEEEEPAEAEPKYVAQELFSHLFRLATQDLEDGWKEVSIDFQHALRDGAKELSADYSVEVKNGDVRQFEPSEVFGPLNAMDKLREMSADQGHPFQRATFRLSSAGSIAVDVDE